MYICVWCLARKTIYQEGQHRQLWYLTCPVLRSRSILFVVEVGDYFLVSSCQMWIPCKHDISRRKLGKIPYLTCACPMLSSRSLVFLFSGHLKWIFYNKYKTNSNYKLKFCSNGNLTFAYNQCLYAIKPVCVTLQICLNKKKEYTGGCNWLVYALYLFNS